MARRENVLQRINTELGEEWEARLNADCRIYYINHKAQTTSWLPPRENWAGSSGLPYGWETGVDQHDKEYFINHVEQYTTRDDPRDDPDYVEPPEPREVELVRDLEKGFGFVAGSEKPVVVRFVTEGGPSEEKLLPGDQILKINGEEVRRAPREKVIELVRSCKESILLTVCQPYTDNSSRKSALLTAAKKAKLKSNPSRVRFADAVLVNGASIAHPSPVESYVPFMPNVLKVFLENGQTKSFKYDNKTTVRDVVTSLQEKLNIRSVHHFSLVLQNMKNSTGTAAKMTLLQEQETLAEIAARQGARYFRCLFRVTFVPKDPYDLLKQDPIAFEYFYLQCCNDVLQERFASEMKYDTALRLAALQIQQHAMSNNLSGKVSIKSVVKECGLDKFVSKSLLETMKGKEVKRLLSQFLKLNHSLAAPGQKQLSALQAKLHYMKMVSHLKTFGSRVFMVTLLDQKTEAMLLVGPHSGVSIVTNIKSYALTQLADFEHLDQVRVTKDGDNMQRVDLRLKASSPQIPHPPRGRGGGAGGGGEDRVISLGLLWEDAHNLVALVAGYYRLFVDPDRRLVERTLGKNTTDPDVPSYESVHRVQPSPWTYPADLVSEVVVGSSRGPRGSGVTADNNQRVVDLAHDPPIYPHSDHYLDRVKKDLGIESTSQMTKTHPDRPTHVTMVRDTPSPDVSSQVKVNGSASLFEEGVTSFGTSSESGPVSSTSLSWSLAGASSLSSHPGLHATIDLRKAVISANGHAAAAAPNGEAQPGESERSSDTDSLSTVDTERRPLLNQSMTQNGDLLRHGGGEAESDDTDSFGTPSGSPAKGRQIPRVSSVESGMHSFGLHSPDILPAADVDFQTLGDVGIHHLPPDVYRAIYRPDANMIPPQRLYFDPDIIDLTIFPLPDSVPDEDNMIDFTALPSLPPPSFANPHPPPASHSPSPSPHPPRHLNGTTQGPDFSNGYPGSVSGSQPGLVRSASADHCPDFFDNDIDSLIAQYYVPPPPFSTSNQLHADQSQVLSHSFSGAISSTPSYLQHHAPLDDDLSSLIIPPPPPSSSSSSSYPADRVEPSVPKEAKERRRHFRHKRSSSVDIGALNLAKQQLLEADKRRSLEEKQLDSTQQGSIRRSSPPHDLNVGEDFDSGTHDGFPAESPATVSMKLHNLLKSLPNLAPEAALANQEQPPSLHRTGSLRMPRSASWDVMPMSQSGAEAAQTFTGKATQRTFFSGTVSLGRHSGHRASSHQQLSSTPAVTAETKPSQSGQQQQQQQQQSPSESFASLKAKLKDYRDHLLRRASHSRRNSGDDPGGSDSGDNKKSSLRRSNSFSRLLAQFSGRRGSKSSEPVVVGDGNWTLRRRGSLSSSTGDLSGTPSSGGGEEERRGGTPVVRESFAVPRTSLRPVSSSTDAAQNKSKKNGPLKALSSVFSSEDRSVHKGQDAVSRRKSSSSSTPSTPTGPQSGAKNSQPYSSKDDLSVLTQESGKKKKNKMKANPYATTKMWRPITMTSSVSQKEDVFHNFDVLVRDDSRLPPTGDLRNEDFLSSRNLSRTIGDPVMSGEFEANVIVGDELPPDYQTHPSPEVLVRSVSYSDDNSQMVKKRLESTRSAPPAPYVKSQGSEAVVKRTAARSSSSTVVTIPLTTRTLSIEEQQSAETLDTAPRRSRPSSRPVRDTSPFPSTLNGGTDIPVDYPHDSSSSASSQRSRSHSEGSRGRRESLERRGRSVMDSSYDVVGLDVSTSIKNILSKTFGSEEFDQASGDVETMLGHLKRTMESLKTLQTGVSSSGSQFQTVRQELQLQTKQFVQDAKCLVACANSPRHAISIQLDTAMQTMARMLLHSQATMVRMDSVHQAQHVGYELLKVAASFKSTLIAANAAMGKPTTDPHMKYLMRQATNLAGLLSTLLKTLKNLEQT